MLDVSGVSKEGLFPQVSSPIKSSERIWGEILVVISLTPNVIRLAKVPLHNRHDPLSKRECIGGERTWAIERTEVQN